MICSKCGKDNLIRANYCAGCGHPFTEAEKKQAYNQTIYGKIDRLKELKGWVTLSKFTGNFFVRLLVLAGIAWIGFFSHSNQGTEMKLLESSEYVIDWNTAKQEYYLYTNLDQVHLRLYLPGKPEGIRVTELDEDGKEVRSEEYDVNTEPVLVKETPFYRISGLYEDEKELQIQACVYDSSLRPEQDH